MIKITELATAKLKEIFAENNKTPETALLRVFVQGGGCSGFQYGLNIEESSQETDKIFESSGVRIAVDPISITYLDGAEVDFMDNESGGFKVSNPKATSTCGCGQSFSTE